MKPSSQKGENCMQHLRSSEGGIFKESHEIQDGIRIILIYINVVETVGIVIGNTIIIIAYTVIVVTCVVEWEKRRYYEIRTISLSYHIE